MTDEQTIHVRLPDATYRALVTKQKSFGIDVSLSVVVRDLLNKALKVKPVKRRT
jgi:hypothetical protein